MIIFFIMVMIILFKISLLYNFFCYGNENDHIYQMCLL